MWSNPCLLRWVSWQTPAMTSLAADSTSST
jgi:hypothetical protein